MRDITVVDKLLDVSISSSYHLSLMIHAGSFSYAILDTVRGKFLAFRSTDHHDVLNGDRLYDKLEQLSHTESYIARNYKKFYFCYTTPKSTLIPAPMFDPGDKEKLSSLFGHQHEPEVLMENYLRDIDSYLVFSLPERLVRIAEDNLDAPQFFHQAYPLLEHALTQAKLKTGKTKVYVAIYPGFLDAVVILDGQLKLYNSFPYKSVKDLVFYILYLYDQFQLTNEQVPVELSGELDEHGELHHYLENYIRQIHFQTFNRSFSYSLGFNDLPQHMFANLINLFGCE